MFMVEGSVGVAMDGGELERDVRGTHCSDAGHYVG
jgi:hypothetical protein